MKTTTKTPHAPSASGNDKPKHSIWQSGYCRIPNASNHMMPNKNKAVVMGVYLWMVQNVRHTDAGEVDGVRLQRGQMLLTYNSMITELGVTLWQARETISALVAAGLITSEVAVANHSRTHLITICDFDNYNGLNYSLSADTRKTKCEDFRNSSIKSLKGIEEGTEEGMKKNSSSKNNSSSLSSSSPSPVQSGKNCELPVGELRRWMLQQYDWREQFQRNNALTDEQMESWLTAFVVHLQNSGVKQKTLIDALYHFNNWFSKRRESVSREEREREEQQRRERERQDEYRRQQAEEKERVRREAQEINDRCMKQMREAARRGDDFAKGILEKYGIDY